MIAPLAAAGAFVLFVLALIAFLAETEDRLAVGLAIGGCIALSLAIVDHVAPPPPPRNGGAGGPSA